MKMNNYYNNNMNYTNFNKTSYQPSYINGTYSNNANNKCSCSTCGFWFSVAKLCASCNASNDFCVNFCKFILLNSFTL